MKYIGLMNISFQQIHAFLAVAKYMNMTKAAAAIHVTQPLLSQRISSLEYETGLQLFTRSNRRLQITPAGEYLNKQWDRIIRDIEENVETARQIQAQMEKGISISFCYGISAQSTTGIMERLHQSFPDQNFNCQLMEIFQMRRELLEHRTDIAISPNYDLEGFGESIEHVTIKESKIKVIVGKDHELAGRKSLEWADLKGANILCQPASQTGGYEKKINSICQERGFTPMFVPCNNIFSATVRMMLGEGILVGVLSPVEDQDQKCVAFEMKEPAIPIVMSYNVNADARVKELAEKCKGVLVEML